MRQESKKGESQGAENLNSVFTLPNLWLIPETIIHKADTKPLR